MLAAKPALPLTTPSAVAPKLIGIALVVAMLAAPVVRLATAGLTHSLGMRFPFSLAHCRVAATPGCDMNAPMHFAAGTATR